MGSGRGRGTSRRTSSGSRSARRSPSSRTASRTNRTSSAAISSRDGLRGVALDDLARAPMGSPAPPGRPSPPQRPSSLEHTHRVGVRADVPRGDHGHVDERRRARPSARGRPCRCTSAAPSAGGASATRRRRRRGAGRARGSRASRCASRAGASRSPGSPLRRRRRTRSARRAVGVVEQRRPAPVFVTFRTGQPKLMSTRSAPAASIIRADSAIAADSEPNSWIASGCSSDGDAEVSERAFVAVLDPGAARPSPSTRAPPRTGGPDAGTPAR